MKKRHRLYVLCEDALHQRFVERLADRWGIGPRQRKIDASPKARGSAAQYVIERYTEAVRQWRVESHDPNVGLLVVIDGDEHGVARRRQQLAQRLKESKLEPIAPSDPVAIVVPTWHIETWIAWLCGHRPVDEQTRYKEDDAAGYAVGRKITCGEYSPQRAVAAWTPPAHDEQTHVPALTEARREVGRLGV
ncbi:uncharacterized protein SOCE26_020890 [Sorangium cellulosum]|uniref:DUF4276 family protein n=1 Tax=Sorangium cellulosum TaxID=56 RepID=A0A2L0EN22_SORCE|nr:hypothetical protein [Sorangium cellulosum]AUX40688.1 uncharacterized protein SOCE26_020890 [Sorangium cellulosum]